MARHSAILALLAALQLLLLHPSAAFTFQGIHRQHRPASAYTRTQPRYATAAAEVELEVGEVGGDMKAINRENFPILDQDSYPGKKLIYLDSAASSQKPTHVLESMDSYYRTSHSNVHRGAHALAVRYIHIQ
jgi:hypothetical protein